MASKERASRRVLSREERGQQRVEAAGALRFTRREVRPLGGVRREIIKRDRGLRPIRPALEDELQRPLAHRVRFVSAVPLQLERLGVDEARREDRTPLEIRGGERENVRPLEKGRVERNGTSREYGRHHVDELNRLLHDAGREVLDAAEQRIFEIADETDNDDAAKLSDLLQKAMDLLEESEGRPITGLGSGYYDLDHLMGGLQPGELIILAARPAMGKTSFAMSIAQNAAIGGGCAAPRCRCVWTLLATWSPCRSGCAARSAAAP